ncbi:DUF3379 family protein [Marinicella rhabdoformis]|uniref:DUF3379 family protein n=1 Tax=Marinicella rhabdoformis TaxID=2580566 RepID=UPI0012AEC9A5|nr:DUF3379 family protein [Marinicella rhabdoformis]
MNFTEFKQTLDANPYADDPAFIHARNHDPMCKAAYIKAMAEEQVLADALNIEVPPHFKNAVIMNQSFATRSISAPHYWAAAASVAIIMTISLLFFGPKPTSDLEDFINEALVMEPTVYMSEDEIPHDQLKPLFASLGTQISNDLGRVHFMKLCPTLDGEGARMVFMNDYNQPITVLYMPHSTVENTIKMQMSGFKGKIIALDKGSAAIIARPHEQTAQIEQSLINNLKNVN